MLHPSTMVLSAAQAGRETRPVATPAAPSATKPRRAMVMRSFPQIFDLCRRDGSGRTTPLSSAAAIRLWPPRLPTTRPPGTRSRRKPSPGQRSPLHPATDPHLLEYQPPRSPPDCHHNAAGHRRSTPVEVASIRRIRLLRHESAWQEAPHANPPIFTCQCSSRCPRRTRRPDAAARVRRGQLCRLSQRCASRGTFGRRPPSHARPSLRRRHSEPEGS